jgi:hypothetical protein
MAARCAADKPAAQRLDRMSRSGAQIGVQILGAGLQHTALDAGLATAAAAPDWCGSSVQDPE